MPWRTKLLPRVPKTIRRFHAINTENLPSIVKTGLQPMDPYPVDFSTADEFIGESAYKRFKK